jgi:hypothetical protein
MMRMSRAGKAIEIVFDIKVDGQSFCVTLDKSYSDDFTAASVRQELSRQTRKRLGDIREIAYTQGFEHGRAKKKRITVFRGDLDLRIGFGDV